MFDVTYEALLEQTLNTWRGRYDIQEGSFLYELVSAILYRLWEFYDSLDAVEDMAFVNENSGEYIDKRAEEFGLERKKGTKARVALTFTGTEGASIPTGTMTEDGMGNGFETLEEAVIGSDGSVSINAECIREGASGNVDAGTITYFSSDIQGVDAVINGEAAQDGTDGETDEALMARLNAFRQRPATSGNAYSYEQWALEVDGVGAAVVYPLENGPGTVGLVIASSDKTPVSPEKTAEVKTHIDKQKPIGVTSVSVRSVVEFAVNVSAEVDVIAAADMEAVKAEFEAALSEYFSKIALKETEIKVSAIGAILMNVSNVADYQAISINGVSGNVGIIADGVPITGEVNLV